MALSIINDAVGPDDALHFSKEALLREPSEIRRVAPLFKEPGMVWFAGGMPHPSTFPFAGITIKLQDGSELEYTGEEILLAQQYVVDFLGYGPLQQWAKDHMREFHSPPAAFEVILTSGSSSATDMVFRTLLDPGDTLLVEEYSYPGAMAAARARGCSLKPVACDANGMCPTALRKVVQDLRDAGITARLLYVIPIGSNPTGVSWSEHRKQEIYRVCQTLNLTLVEDDAYWYTQYITGVDECEQPGLNLGRSLLSFDTDGRVVRMDTLSKVLAPGLRCGWISAPPRFIQKLVQVTQNTTLYHAGMPAIAVDKLLRHWGREGFEASCRRLQSSYAQRSSTLNNVLEVELLPLGVTKWNQPRAGMFVWLELVGITDAEDDCMSIDTLKNAKVAVVHGRSFSPSKALTPFVRVSYALVPNKEDMVRGVRALADILRKRHGIIQPGAS